MKQPAHQTYGNRATLRIFCVEGILNMDTYLRNYDASILALARLHPLSISRSIYDHRNGWSEVMQG
jgi:hypothetical protein